MKRLIPFLIILSIAGYFGYRAWINAQEAKANDLFYGTVEADEVRISAQLAGQLVEFNAVEGGRVNQGDLLARLDEKIYAAQLAQAEAAVQTAGSQTNIIGATLDGLNTEIARTSKLLDTGSAAAMQFDQLSTQKRALDAQKNTVYAQVNQAKKAVELAQTQLSYAQIHAPIAGTILHTYVRLGETVFPGSALLVLADLSKMKINVYVPEPMLGKIKLGQAVEVFNDTYPEQTMAGTVARIADQAEFTPKNVQTKDERVRLIYKIEIAIDNPDGVLKIGMPVDVRFLEK